MMERGMQRTVRWFSRGSKLEDRALQAWIILVGAAKRRQTIRYGELASLMFGSRALRNIGRILGHIAYHCEWSSLPSLNCIVVNTSGRPGTGIPQDSDKLRERVFDYPWYDVVPPSPGVLRESFLRGPKRR
jgi:alkylated DNA nucleotide flippase Atl1